MNKAIIILIITVICSCGGNPPSRVYVTGKKIIPENETTSEQTEYCLFIKRVNGTKFSFGSVEERIIHVDKESYDKLKLYDTLKNRY